MEQSITVTSGRPLPLGPTATPSGTNFSLFSRHGTRVWLLLFDAASDDKPSHTFALDPHRNRTGDLWHIHLAGVGHGQLYLYQVDGPYQPEQGHRFNRYKPLLDPHAKAIAENDCDWDFRDALGYNPFAETDADLTFSDHTNFANTVKCVVYGDDGFDWQGDRPLNRPLAETIIYETHVRSLTYHPTSRAKYPGTYRGVIEKIPYFKALGVTAIELLPIHYFNEWDFERHNPLTGERLRNYWGYNTLNFFAPMGCYSHLSWERGGPVMAFKEMVRALHQAGLELILDVVFNHTIEGNELGPTISFRGLDNSIYYLLAENKRYYQNISGVGNTFNCNHPVGQDFIIECLRYWVQEMHVDGFRFDLATILSRDRWGHVSGDPPLPVRIAEDPILRHTKLIAEPWDLGHYQVGHYPGGRWAEWNDRFRDDVRQFWRGEHDLAGPIATRIGGSSDLFSHSGRTPNHSINFIAAHDGFTLNDLVSYNDKDNTANGENNHDGHDKNYSYNHGTEDGPSDDPGIEGVRNRQVKNFLATLMLAQGTPMLNGGDEFRRTQKGNNNAYCQHNEISWYDWRYVNRYADIHRFARYAILMRQAHPIFRRTIFFTGEDRDDDQMHDIYWYNPNGCNASWASHSRAMMCMMDGAKEETGANRDDVDVLMMFNADLNSHLFYLPPAPHSHRWHVALDTGLPAPYDIRLPGREIEVGPSIAYQVHPRSMVVLFAKPVDTQVSRWILQADLKKHVVLKRKHLVRYARRRRNQVTPPRHKRRRVLRWR
jgi:glycogen operon protein